MFSLFVRSFARLLQFQIELRLNVVFCVEIVVPMTMSGRWQRRKRLTHDLSFVEFVLENWPCEWRRRAKPRRWLNNEAIYEKYRQLFSLLFCLRVVERKRRKAKRIFSTTISSNETKKVNEIEVRACERSSTWEVEEERPKYDSNFWTLLCFISFSLLHFTKYFVVDNNGFPLRVSLSFPFFHSCFLSIDETTIRLITLPRRTKAKRGKNYFNHKQSSTKDRKYFFDSHAQEGNKSCIDKKGVIKLGRLLGRERDAGKMEIVDQPMKSNQKKMKKQSIVTSLCSE